MCVGRDDQGELDFEEESELLHFYMAIIKYTFL